VPAFFGSIGGAAGELGHARLKRGKGGPAIAPRFSSSDFIRSGTNCRLSKAQLGPILRRF
jgi:hypothetical protein